MSAPTTDRPVGSAPVRGAHAVRTPLLAGLLLLAVLVVLTLLVMPAAPPLAPVEVGRFFTPAQVAREQGFHAALRAPAYASLVVSLLVAGVLGLTRLGGRLVAALGRLVGGSLVGQVVLGTLALTVVGRLVTLPLAVRHEQVLRDYGLSHLSWAGWAADVGKQVLVSAVIASLALVLVIALARRLPRTWWMWGAGVVAALVVAGSFAYPLVVEPLFQPTHPLAAGPLRTELLALAHADGVPVSDVLVADAAQRTSAENAYVSGFGSTKRIVLYDTLLANASPQQVRLVVAHELGHAKNEDVLVGTGLGAVGGAAAVCLLAAALSAGPVLRRVGARGPGDPRVVAVVLFAVAAGTFVVTPAVNAYSRRIEARADRHSLQLTGDVPGFINNQQQLALANLSELDPGPLTYALFATHPTAPQRIAAALAYGQGRR